MTMNRNRSEICVENVAFTTSEFLERKEPTLVGSIEKLKNMVKWSNFMANYIALPCVMVSTTLVFVGPVNMQGFNLIMAGMNGLAYWLNTKIRDRCLRVLDCVAEVERLKKIRSLNPNRDEQL